jgi:glyoxalase family protein
MRPRASCPDARAPARCHHVAFRAVGDGDQAEMARKLVETHGQKDRNYFRSVYFREPGWILFEIATDIPGFAVDEPSNRSAST